jgi:hypothetical protein
MCAKVSEMPHGGGLEEEQREGGMRGESGFGAPISLLPPFSSTAAAFSSLDALAVVAADDDDDGPTSSLSWAGSFFARASFYPATL